MAGVGGGRARGERQRRLLGEPRAPHQSPVVSQGAALSRRARRKSRAPLRARPATPNSEHLAPRQRLAQGGPHLDSPRASHPRLDLIGVRTRERARCPTSASRGAAPPTAPRRSRASPSLYEERALGGGGTAGSALVAKAPRRTPSAAKDFGGAMGVAVRRVVRRSRRPGERESKFTIVRAPLVFRWRVQMK